MSAPWRYRLLFAFLGIACAEVLSGNQPFAPLLPPAYGMYGILQVLVLDVLLRFRVRSWGTVYLLGVGLGYCIETFVAKLAWFGGPTCALNPGGVLPLPEFPVLVLCFHPLLSLMLPVYLFRRWLDFPLDLGTSPRADRLLPWLLPLVPAAQLATFPRPLGLHLLGSGLTLLGLRFLVGWARAAGSAEDLLLFPRTRHILALLAGILLPVWIPLVPAPGHGRPLIPGPHQLLAALAFLALVAWAVHRRLGQAGSQAMPHESSQEAIPRWPWVRFWLLQALLCGLFRWIAGPVRVVWVLLLLGGGLGGTLAFLRVFSSRPDYQLSTRSSACRRQRIMAPDPDFIPSEGSTSKSPRRSPE